MMPILTLSTTTAVQQWSEIIAGLGTVILTVFLVVLYKRQQEQLAAQHEAVLEVTDVEWYGDRAIVWVSNFGNGVAKNLSLATLVKSDVGNHRTHTVRSTALKRIDKDGEWTNHIQSGEEDIPFHGKSKVGQIAPQDWPRDWMSLSFSAFVRRAKREGATEVKFCHVVQGAELSKNSCWDQIEPMTQSVNPQNFDSCHTLENLPSVTKHGLDSTFYPYFRESSIRKWAVNIYSLIVRTFDILSPGITVQPRVLDASGTKRVKRVLLKRQLKRKAGSLRDSVPAPAQVRKLSSVLSRYSGQDLVLLLVLLFASMVVGSVYFPTLGTVQIPFPHTTFALNLGPQIIGLLAVALTGCLSIYIVHLLNRYRSFA